MTPQRRKWLIGLTACVWSSAVAVSLIRYRLAANAGVTIVLATQPAHVRLTLNNQKYAEGAYVETPLEIPVAAGKTRLKIAREGYVAHIVSVEGDAGARYKMEDVVLQKSTEAGFLRLAVEMQNADKNLFIEVDDGFARGETPLIVNDLAKGRPHMIAVYPSWPKREPVARCQLANPKIINASEPHVVKIRRTKGGKVSFVGCTREKTPRS